MFNNVSGGRLEPIIIPFFPVFDAIDAKYYTILSWLTFAGGLVIGFAIIIWVGRILLAGIEAVRSSGDPDKLKESYDKVKADFMGVGLTLIFPIILTIIGAFLGIGNIFDWPRMFSGCEDPAYEYYFQAYLQAPRTDDALQFADDRCR
jgi:hypothetical protein